jgi:hypothetical protein
MSLSVSVTSVLLAEAMEMKKNKELSAHNAIVPKRMRVAIVLGSGNNCTRVETKLMISRANPVCTNPLAASYVSPSSEKFSKVEESKSTQSSSLHSPMLPSLV